MANWDPNAPMPPEVQATCELYEQLGKEVLVSYAILDCASHERAMEIAARVCDTVDVRPIESGLS